MREPHSLLGQSVGSVVLESLIGAGGYAWVFAGRAAGDGKARAVKVLQPRFAGDAQLRARFAREAEVASELRHPNIIRILEVSTAGDLAYFSMPMLPTSLAKVLEEEGALPEQRVAEIARDVARALAFAHESGIIHRDVKTQNVLFKADRTAVVSDFGIARAVASYASTTGKQLTIGTPHYISPEQAQGRALDGRTDLYALGVTMYRAATGELPFRSSNWYELARLHVEVPPRPPRERRPELSPSFERVVLTCLAKQADERYATAADLVAALDALLSA